MLNSSYYLYSETFGLRTPLNMRRRRCRRVERDSEYLASSVSACLFSNAAADRTRNLPTPRRDKRTTIRFLLYSLTRVEVLANGACKHLKSLEITSAPRRGGGHSPGARKGETASVSIIRPYKHLGSAVTALSLRITDYFYPGILVRIVYVPRGNIRCTADDFEFPGGGGDFPVIAVHPRVNQVRTLRPFCTVPWDDCFQLM